jgi:dTDP-4-amino-4,6-dideoxygalactose transaminase
MRTPLDARAIDTLLPYEWPGSYYLGQEEIDAVTKAIEARSLFRFYGHDLQHFADRLEEAYRVRLGRAHALAVSSGTAALSIAMGMLDVGPGDEVLLPGYFWVSCASAVVRAGAIPRLVDIDDTFSMDPADLERKIGGRSKAILMVHMSGATGELDAILEIARRHGVPVIEDVAQANGGSYRGRPLGSFGEVAIFSFQFNKAITAGEGGLIACDDTGLYRRAVALHDLGYPRDDAGRLDAGDPDAQLWGFGSRMGELGAGVLLAQERKLEALVQRMRSLKHRIEDGLAGVEGLRPRRSTDPEGGNGSFVILIWPDGLACRTIVHATREAGVRTGEHGLNNLTFDEWGLHLYYNNESLVNRRGLNSRGYPWRDPANAFAADYAYARGALPQADDLFSRSSLLAIPPCLTEDAADRVVEAYRAAARAHGLGGGA